MPRAHGMPKTLERLTLKSFEQPDEVREFEKGRLELVTIAGRTIGRAVFQPGWKWSECVKPIAKTKSCEAAHFGYQLSGRMMIAGDDGSQTIMNAGEAASIPPGHDAWVLGGEPVVFIDFQGFADYAKRK